MINENLVLGILGPTATGKTQLACELHDILPIDLISVDSSMVYRGMDIGTAKPSLELQKKYPHKLIDIREPTDPYSVGDFIKDVIPEIQHSINNNRLPCLVGGTMMYFNAIQNGLSELPAADLELRKKISAMAQNSSWETLHSRLNVFDPITASKIKKTDTQRIQRAIEVYILTNKPLSSFKPNKPRYSFTLKLFGILPEDRSKLHNIIEYRFKSMLEKGFIDEVKQLMRNQELNLELPSMRAVGYRQAYQYLQGNITLDQMYEKAVFSTRQLAKRQITWLRGWENIILSNTNLQLKEKILSYLDKTTL